MQRLNSIQSLRFLAASGVVLAHTSSGYFPFGAAGVDVFFVVSGFIIAKVMARRQFGAFTRDRLIRIYPIYWLVLLPMTIIAWDGDWLRLLSSITLWPVFGEFRRPFLVVGWTLYFEMLFYAAASFVVWRLWVVWPLVLGYLAALIAGTSPILLFVGSSMIFEFGMGVVIATVRPTELKLTGAIAIVIGILAIALAPMATFSIENAFNGVAWNRPIILGLPAALVVWGALQWESRLTGYWGWVSRGGDASYSIYLTHPLLYLALAWNPYVLLIGTPLIIAAGIATHYWVEAPLLRSLRGGRPSFDGLQDTQFVRRKWE